MRAHPPRPRRHRSQQRERILEFLRASEAHPTAAQTHQALLRELPNLSLGTVYRNLEVLVAEGVVDEVPSAGGTRYDGNPKPHHHFICEGCGAIDDLHLVAPRSLAQKLRRARGRSASRIKIEFFGLCESCESHGSNAGSGVYETRRTKWPSSRARRRTDT
ncbi:MAG TPA: transcriptional repressor [Myxococcota bacterium]|nr:transcriptional repressor [Myxococcota bacterium]